MTKPLTELIDAGKLKILGKPARNLPERCANKNDQELSRLQSGLALCENPFCENGMVDQISPVTGEHETAECKICAKATGGAQ
jgi:hypothetical protein